MPDNKSKVLLLLICSNTKYRKGESPEYRPSKWSMPRCLPATHSRLLYQGRRQMYNLITGDSASRHGTLLRDLPFNKGLVPAPDLLFIDAVKGGSYLPAAHRYRGRFYRELGPGGASLLTDTPHHVLIMSGLYGLLTPSEPIQLYSCHVPDHPAIARCWTENDRLTRLLVAYIERLAITRVFDLTAVDTYRNLVSWEMVRHATGGGVLHPFSSQYVGDSLLPSLGILAKRLLQASETELMALKHGDPEPLPDFADQLLYYRFPLPVAADAAEQQKEIAKQEQLTTINDMIGRMRRNMIKILACIETEHGLQDQFWGFGERVRGLERARHLPRDTARRIQSFERLRNRVEYDGYMVTNAEWKRIGRYYHETKMWASFNRYLRAITLEPIDAWH